MLGIPDHTMEMAVSCLLWLFYPWRKKAPDNLLDTLNGAHTGSEHGGKEKNSAPNGN